MIPKTNPLASVGGPFNGVLIGADAAGDLMLYGRGAGDLPTASAMVSDAINVAQGLSLIHIFFVLMTNLITPIEQLLLGTAIYLVFMAIFVALTYCVLGAITEVPSCLPLIGAPLLALSLIHICPVERLSEPAGDRHPRQTTASRRLRGVWSGRIPPAAGRGGHGACHPGGGCEHQRGRTLCVKEMSWARRALRCAGKES